MNGKVLSFYLDGNLFGLDILAVKEIDRNIEYTPVSDAPPYVVGLLNMRGQVVTLFNLAGMMGYELADRTDGAGCIILKNKPENPDYMGFLIDHLGSVIDIEQEMCEPPPANISSVGNLFVDEVAKIGSELLLIINPEVIFGG